MALADSEMKGAAVLQSGDSSDEAVRALLPLIKAKMYEHGYDTGKVGDLFLKLDRDRSGMISPSEFFERMAQWGVQLTAEQCLHLLEPFDIDFNGEIDYTEFCEWVSMWDPSTEDGEDGAWYRGGSLDRRVWAASGAGTGRVGRVRRLMQMIDVDHDGNVESWEFIRALSKGDDFDRPVMGGGAPNGGLGGGRLNPDGSLKAEYKDRPFGADDGAEQEAPVLDAAPEDEDAWKALLQRLAKQLEEGGSDLNNYFNATVKKMADIGHGAISLPALEMLLDNIGVDTTGAKQLVEKYGEEQEGGGGKALPIWMLMQALALHGTGGQVGYCVVCWILCCLLFVVCRRAMLFNNPCMFVCVLHY
jgi:Ca2+-binding EF-hand superfamily protein